MILLNTNYDDLFQQVRDIEKFILSCDNSIDCTISYYSYQSILEMLGELTGRSFPYSKDVIKQCEKYQVSSCDDQLIEMRDSNFIENKDYHLAFLCSAYFECSSIINKVFNHPDVDWLMAKSIPDLDIVHNQDRNLVLNFFQNENKLLLQYYLEMEAMRNFYLCPKSDFFDIRGGLTVFNPVCNCCNLFFKSSYPNFTSLQAVPHEMGHVIDFYDYRERFSLQSQGLMTLQGIYGEVISSYYEQKFLEYYLEHGNRLDDVTLSLLLYFDQRLQYLWDVLVVTMMEEQDIRYIMNHSVYLNDCHEILVENGHLTCMPELDDEGRILFLDDALEYGYGFVLANYFLDYPDIYQKFLNIRSGDFDARKLESIGVTSSEVSRSLVKRTEKIFGRYL